jgi:hypothetical protein
MADNRVTTPAQRETIHPTLAGPPREFPSSLRAEIPSNWRARPWLRAELLALETELAAKSQKIVNQIEAVLMILAGAI